MSSHVYVVDTCALIWFVRGDVRLGLAARQALLNPTARVVVPAYSIEEIQRKFSPYMQPTRDIPAIPPTPLLRLLAKCSNAKVLDRGLAVIAREIALKNSYRANGINADDFPIAAAALIAKQYCGGPVVLLTSDGLLRRWARGEGITVIWK